jgi:hypothetical protein
MSYQSNLTLVFRAGYELQCQPTSTYSSYLRLSPPYDPIAINDYYAISRELKDAYPSDYNDWGKLWNVIKSAARTVIPFVRGLGPIGAGVAAVGDLLLGPADKPSNVANGPRDSLPAATVERAQRVKEAKEVMAGTQRRTTRPQKRPVKKP